MSAAPLWGAQCPPWSRRRDASGTILIVQDRKKIGSHYTPRFNLPRPTVRQASQCSQVPVSEYRQVVALSASMVVRKLSRTGREANS